MNITMDGSIVEKLRKLLDGEGEEAVVRVRETKIGSACKARTVLRLSIDSREDDDVAFVINAIPFVINSDLADQYGTEFTASFQEEEQAFDVKAVQ